MKPTTTAAHRVQKPTTTTTTTLNKSKGKELKPGLEADSYLYTTTTNTKPIPEWNFTIENAKQGYFDKSIAQFKLDPFGSFIQTSEKDKMNKFQSKLKENEDFLKENWQYFISKKNNIEQDMTRDFILKSCSCKESKTIPPSLTSCHFKISSLDQFLFKLYHSNTNWNECIPLLSYDYATTTTTLFKYITSQPIAFVEKALQYTPFVVIKLFCLLKFIFLNHNNTWQLISQSLVTWNTQESMELYSLIQSNTMMTSTTTTTTTSINYSYKEQIQQLICQQTNNTSTNNSIFLLDELDLQCIMTNEKSFPILNKDNIIICLDAMYYKPICSFVLIHYITLYLSSNNSTTNNIDLQRILFDYLHQTRHFNTNMYMLFIHLIRMNLFSYDQYLKQCIALHCIQEHSPMIENLYSHRLQDQIQRNILLYGYKKSKQVQISVPPKNLYEHYFLYEQQQQQPNIDDDMYLYIEYGFQTNQPNAYFVDYYNTCMNTQQQQVFCSQVTQQQDYWIAKELQDRYHVTLSMPHTDKLYLQEAMQTMTLDEFTSIAIQSIQNNQITLYALWMYVIYPHYSNTNNTNSHYLQQSIMQSILIQCAHHYNLSVALLSHLFVHLKWNQIVTIIQSNIHVKQYVTMSFYSMLHCKVLDQIPSIKEFDQLFDTTSSTWLQDCITHYTLYNDWYYSSLFYLYMKHSQNDYSFIYEYFEQFTNGFNCMYHMCMVYKSFTNYTCQRVTTQQYHSNIIKIIIRCCKYDSDLAHSFIDGLTLKMNQLYDQLQQVHTWDSIPLQKELCTLLQDMQQVIPFVSNISYGLLDLLMELIQHTSIVVEHVQVWKECLQNVKLKHQLDIYFERKHKHTHTSMISNNNNNNYKLIEDGKVLTCQNCNAKHVPLPLSAVHAKPVFKSQLLFAQQQQQQQQQQTRKKRPMEQNHSVVLEKRIKYT